MNADNQPVLPFLKWAGGKRWLVRKLRPLLESGFRNYFEPFLGGGAVLLSVRPQFGVASDINNELVNCYNQIKKYPKEITFRLSGYQTKHSDEFYYHVRDLDPIDEIERAVRFIYLNRACFNGIYRVNKNGRFNVPRGTKETIVFEGEDFELIASALMGVDVLQSDFESVIERASSEDLVFVDPPYTTKHNKNGFVRYNEKMFTWSDQERLASAVERAFRRGSKVIVTNADHPSVRNLYSEISAAYVPVARYSIVGGPKETRSKITEAIFLLGFGDQCVESLVEPVRSNLIALHS